MYSWTSKRCIVSEEKAKETGIKSQQPKYNVNMLAILWELIYPFPDITNVIYARVRVKQLSSTDISQVNIINVKEVLMYSRCINFKDWTVNMVHNTMVIQCDENIIVHV